MPLTSLNPNLLGTDSTGASKLSSAGGLVQLHATGLLAIANNTANNFAVTNTGSVGIGTVSPSVRLQVTSGSDGELVRLTNTLGGERLHLYTRVGGSAISRVESQNANLDLATYDGYPLTLSTSGTEKARFDTSGNFIIGNTVANTVTGGRQLTLQNNGFATISVQATDGGNDRNATLELLSSGNGGSASQIIFGDTDTTPGTPSPLVFAGYHSGTKTERMRIVSTGHTLVGTNSISAADQNGTLLYVNSGLIAAGQKIVNNSASFFNTTNGGTRNVIIQMPAGEYYAKLILVGLCGYFGGGFFTRVIEFTGFGSEASIATISNVVAGGNSPPTVTMTAPSSNVVNAAVVFPTNYRCVAYLQTAQATGCYISSISGTNV